MTPPPVGDRQPGKRDAVEQMFDGIAARYDLLNRVLSFGIDRLWRRRAINWLIEDRPRRILDVATGTGDLALAALRLGPEKVVGVDLSEGMLVVGREKVARRGATERVTLLQADATHLPFEDGHFDAVLVAFGVRNFEDLDAGLAEIGRVLRAGAPLVVLEFSQPDR
ncbi:MAG TPA: ubiquinone/menaquinone biosynthesis methyltransferase, partial [Rhodothermales bacterium]|nr:ubiquinone/menaquinone biosynthesis methyltransferase [Rhodothermales bacterium]